MGPRSDINWLGDGLSRAGGLEVRARETAGLRVTKTKSTIFIVEDDASVLRALRRLLTSAGFEVRSFQRPASLLASDLPAANACLILDVYLPEMSGVDLYESLAASGCKLPVVMITGHDDERTRAMINRIDAAAVLVKPYAREAMLGEIHKALAASKPEVPT